MLWSLCAGRRPCAILCSGHQLSHASPQPVRSHHALQLQVKTVIHIWGLTATLVCKRFRCAAVVCTARNCLCCLHCQILPSRRYFETDAFNGVEPKWWFGGGSDITPSYVNEEDMKQFHGVYKVIIFCHVLLKEQCN